ncbi:MAG: HAD-IA family hydrolase [Solobacterium sp.]|nr:HAD-IA family hydrolase [Solobacterium sp.]
MRERTINGVFFDLGWTLEKPADDDWTLTPCFFSYVPKEKFYSIDSCVRTQAMNRAMEPLIKDHHMTSLEEEYQRFIQYYRDLNSFLSLDLGDFETEAIAYDHTWNFSNYIVFDSTKQTILTLKEHGYKIGIISDTWPSTVPQQKEAGLLDLYDHTVLSFDLGVVKPDPLMYTTALEGLGLPGEETVYVDDLPMSLDAASAFRIRGVRSTAPDPSVKDTRYPCITKPSELLDVLRELNGGIL